MIEVYSGKRIGIIQLGQPNGRGAGWLINLEVRNVGKKWITLVGSTLRFDVATQCTGGGAWDPLYQLVDVDDPELTRRRLRTTIQNHSVSITQHAASIRRAQTNEEHVEALTKLQEVVSALAYLTHQRGSGLPAAAPNREGEN